jgi:OmpA-OmpF porin, OOP family
MPRRSFSLRTLSLLTFAVPTVLLPQLAEAQAPVPGNFALDRYEPTPVSDLFFAVPSGSVEGESVIRGGFYIDYAKDPLVLQDTCMPDGTACNEEGTERGAIVGDHLFGHMALSLALLDRILVDVNIPVALVANGDSPFNERAPGSVVQSPGGGTLGDLRLGLRIQLLGDTKGKAELALGTNIWVPTGDAAEFTSDDRVRAMPYAALSGRLSSFVYGVNLGVMTRESSEFVNVKIGTELRYGFAAGLMLADDVVQIGPELYGGTVVGQGVDPFKGRTTNAELLFGAKIRAGSFLVGAAAGPGIAHGMGTPSARVIGVLAYSPSDKDSDGDKIIDKNDACPQVAGVPDADPAKNGCPPDKDGDGILDQQDACPNEPGVPDADPAKNGCPIPPDRDGDTIVDTLDACPDVAGVANQDPKKNGCPPDRDNDTILDAVDACPDVAGVADADPAKNGCPPDKDGDTIIDSQDACPDIPGIKDPDPAKNGCPGDRDGDGIRDDQDACPDEKGPPDQDPAQNGCPKLVRVTKSQIVIKEQVQFEFAKDRILPASDALLTEVMGVLKDHPEIKKVRIEGHTDDKGADAVNQRLSDRRAASVMKWLTDKGVDAGRLEAKGWGETKPIGDNKTDEGRQKNRRVEFHIVDPAPSSEVAAPPAGTTPPATTPPATTPPAATPPAATPPTGVKAPATPAPPAAPATPPAAPKSGGPTGERMMAPGTPAATPPAAVPPPAAKPPAAATPPAPAAPPTAKAPTKAPEAPKPAAAPKPADKKAPTEPKKP